jgi:hypothetical protein
MTKCPFINSKKACTFDKKMNYGCPLLFGPDVPAEDIECLDLPEVHFNKINKIFRGAQ